MQIKGIGRILLIGMLLIFSAISNAQEAPTVLEADVPVSGELDNNNISDIYTFVSTANGILNASIISDGLTVGMLVTDASSNIIIEQLADDTGALTLTDVILEQEGAYFVTVFSSSAEAGTYELSISFEGDEELAVEPEAPLVEPEETETSTGEFVTSLPDQPDVLLSNGMEVRLQWSAAVDLNLEVRDPRGNTLFFDSRTSPIGGSFGFDANGICEVISEAPVETATWQPGFLPVGSYEILVFYRQSCDESSEPVPFTLTVTIDGEVLPLIEATIPPRPTPNSASVYLANFIIEDEETAIINQGGQYPDTALNNLPATVVELRDQAVPIERNQVINGAIFEAQDYVVYSFQAQDSEIITASMTATSRNLDTLLQMVDPNGNLIAVNDDSNNSTNSTISNQRIVQDGSYLLVATRYGKELGGTEGEFTLSVTESTSTLPDNVANLNVPDGDIQVYLTWNNATDLQLLVRDPVGQAVYDDDPQVTSGGLLAEDGNANCVISEGDPLSYIYWPTGLLRPGTYEIEVWFQNQCDETGLVDFTLTVVVAGEVALVERNTPAIGDRFVTNFTVNPDGSVNTGRAGFISSGVTFADLENETRLNISPNVPVQGAITLDNAFDVYAFDGTAGQIVTISMQASAGSILDTNVFLLSEAGIQLANNDDAPEGAFVGTQGRTTDSLINGFVLPADGQYLVVASRFATVFGGTTGAYQLTLQFGE
ncbi:MAG: hypothetical protein ACFE0Q_03690 [Anaerolineae bacterium]